MSFDIGINFRASAGFVTDGANETYSLGETYPQTRGGVTFGWDLDATPRDRNAGVDRRLAGMNSTVDGNDRTFRLDLPAAGQYTIRLAMGDIDNGSVNSKVVIKDNVTTLLTIGPHSTGVDEFYDAADASYSSANWPTSNTGAVLTFASTTLNLVVDGVPAVSNSVVAHLRVTSVDSGGYLLVAN